jgi:hypothetical protein
VLGREINEDEKKIFEGIYQEYKEKTQVDREYVV